MTGSPHDMSTIGEVDQLLHDVLEIYSSAQRQKEKNNRECTGLNVSELSAVLKSFYPLDKKLVKYYPDPFAINTPRDKAAIYYSHKDPTPIDPSVENFPLLGFELCKAKHQPMDEKPFLNEHIPMFCREGPLDLQNLQLKQIQPSDLIQTFYYCIWLYMLNAKGLMRKIYKTACDPENYSDARDIAKKYIDREEEFGARPPVENSIKYTGNENRITATAPEVFGSEIYPPLWKITKGNLLVRKFGAHLISSVAMSCMDERSFGEAMEIYLIGILNQNCKWMRYEMMVDLLRTFTAALDIQSRARKDTKDAFVFSAKHIIAKFDNKENISKYRFISTLTELKNKNNPPFFGYSEEKRNTNTLDEIILFLEDICFAFAKRYRYNPGRLLMDKEVLFYHWDKLFNALGRPFNERIQIRNNNAHLGRKVKVANMNDSELKEHIHKFFKDTMGKSSQEPREIDLNYTLDIEEIIVGKQLIKRAG